MLCISTLAHTGIKVIAAKGNVYVRHNVEEQWVPVSVGDVLKPEDSMRLDQKSTATIVIDGNKKLTLPELVIVDLSDLRMLTQEDLLLKLAMEHIRSIPIDKRDNEFKITRTTSVHSPSKENKPVRITVKRELGELQLNGTKVLYDNGFYATCVLRAKEVFRLFPDLSKRFDGRLLIGTALEMLKLNGEAFGEYTSLLEEQLSTEQRAIVKKKLAQLRKERRENSD